MIKELRLRHFKKFKMETFALRPAGLTLLAGDNNSGKSSLIQAAALWQFCVQSFTQQRGAASLASGALPQPLAVTMADLTPLPLPDFRYLWTAQRTTAKIEVSISWDSGAGATQVERRLSFSIGLTQQGVEIGVRHTNVAAGDRIPKAAFLPAFAGIKPNEHALTEVERDRLIGEGLAGAVLRNVLADMHRAFATGLHGLRGRRRADFLKASPWWRLSQILQQVFGVGLLVDAAAGAPIRVQLQEVVLNARGMPKRAPKAKARDIMVEGSGFLQWLSVYTLAVRPDLDTLLLDEPDAHLHKQLQDELVFRVRSLVGESRQVILATHSIEILGEAECPSIYWLERTQHGYLKDDDHRRRLFLGLGGLYAPKIQLLKKYKKLLMVEGPSDAEILRILSVKVRGSWPSDIVVWHYKENDLEKSKYGRRQLFAELRDEIAGLKGLSLEDRDDKAHFKSIPQDLGHAGKPKDGLALRMWRRRNLENYLLQPAAIARATGKTDADVSTFLLTSHGYAVAGAFTDFDCHPSLALIDGKQILSSHPESVFLKFGVHVTKVADAMQAAEVPADVVTLINDVHDIWTTL